ncbi:MAG: InlB B-repeat-containing protein [Planctomycetota bacterium]
MVRSPDKASYSYGETVVLEAVPDTGYHFVDWSGAVTGGSNPVSVVMDGDKSVVASFAVNTYTLDGNPGGGAGYGLSLCGLVGGCNQRQQSGQCSDGRG